MLARNFLKASHLQITDEQHDALVKVLDLLERQEIPADLFKMNVIGYPRWDTEKGYCGSPGCILGWAKTFHEGAEYWGALDHPGLSNLFMFTPMDAFRDCAALMEYQMRRQKVTMEQAACALRNYLTTGNPDWDGVLK